MDQMLASISIFLFSGWTFFCGIDIGMYITLKDLMKLKKPKYWIVPGSGIFWAYKQSKL